MNDDNLSIQALLARRELAEKATPGPWEKDGDHIYTEWSREYYPERGYQSEVAGFSEIRVATTENWSSDISDDETAGNASHIAANSPDVVIATIDELLRLRAECARLEREANWLAGYLTIGAHESYDAARRRWREAARRAVEEKPCP